MNIDELKILYGRTTQGTWESVDHNVTLHRLQGCDPSILCGWKNNMEFIAAIHNAFPDICAEMERLQRENKILEKLCGADNLCSDHRDKQIGRPCLACLLESSERQLRRVNEACQGKI